MGERREISNGVSKFLVTGGAGFIGSHIVEVLVEKGCFVRVLDNFSSGKEENLKNSIGKIEVIRGDIRDRQVCLKATKGVEFVLHQAALRSVPKSMKDPLGYNDVNINGTLKMLEASLENKVKRFVLASSSSVYGETKKFPEREDFLPGPISPYALTKLAGEHYCRLFTSIYGLSTVSLRYFNVFGPRQAADDEYAVVVPKFITCILKGESPPIYGTGRQSRDFTYIGNIVQANILATKKKDVDGQVFNIAGGHDYTILELVGILNKIMKKNVKPAFLNKRQGDIFKTEADLSRAKKMLGFTPKIDFVEGLRLTTEYFKKKAA